MEKLVSLYALFPELKGECEFEVRAKGHNFRSAIITAIRDLFLNPKLKRKHLSVVKIRVAAVSDNGKSGNA